MGKTLSGNANNIMSIAECRIKLHSAIADVNSILTWALLTDLQREKLTAIVNMIEKEMATSFGEKQ